MSRGEFLFEFIMEVFPVKELVGPGILRFLFPTEDADGPLLSTTRFHIGHGPYDFGLFIRKVLGTELDVGLTGIQECYSFGAVSIKFCRHQRMGLTGLWWDGRR